MSSIRKVVQCSGHTKSGARCTRRTAKSTECWQHLALDQGLKITKSTIRGAGQGLFTLQDRRKRQKVTEYTGDRVVSHDPNYGGDYVLQVKTHPPTFINANKTTEKGLGRWANHAKAGDGVRNNSHLSVSTRYGTAGIVMKQNVHATKAHPREILTSYGREYWHGR